MKFMCLYNLKDIACSVNEELFDNLCEKENMEMHETYDDDKYYENFGENNDQIPTSSASTDSSANNVQPKKRLFISRVKNVAKKMLTDTNILAKKPLSQFNINAMSGNFENVYISIYENKLRCILYITVVYLIFKID